MKRLHAAIFLCCVALAAQPAATADETSLRQQRELFRTLHAEAERGNWNPVDQLGKDERQLIEDYVLWPDLRATWLKASIRSVDDIEVDAFLLKHGAIKPARELRYRHAMELVRNGDLAAYLNIYQQFYQGQDIATLDCLALQAELAAGRTSRVRSRAIELWTVAKSQAKECDPVFEWLQTENLLGLLQYQQRYELAIEARNFTLARWLGKQIDAAHVDSATEWLRAQSDPEAFLRKRRRGSDNDTLRDQLVYATEQLTYKDPLVAQQLWAKTVRRYAFSESQKLRTARHIALWIARDNLPGAYKALTKLPVAAQNDEVLRWRARVSLRDGKWKNLLADTDVMADDERSSEEWRYWRAIARIRTGDAAAALPDLTDLSKERSYYGFLAADKVKRSYTLRSDILGADEVRLAAIAGRLEIRRARELFEVGLDGRGRSEWDAVVRYMSDDDKLQAAILAHRWGWHSRAIAAVASLGQYDDLALRYPLPFKETFEASSSQASVATTWAYGIARSESLFMRDVRSHAGAVGLMQLMPATGREVAASIKLPYSGLATLTDPEHNIRLGTTYLGQMAERYGGNYVPATAAYNAGPHRVDTWLPEHGSEDARIWIENIPFNETRKYVKRVLAAQTIFHWRMTGQVRRLTDLLPEVRARQEQLASR